MVYADIDLVNLLSPTETASYKGKWFFGYDIWICDQGEGCGVNFGKQEKPYPTEKEAFKAACKQIRSYLMRHEFDYSGQKRLWDKKLMTLLNEVEHPQPVELDLFS